MTRALLALGLLALPAHAQTVAPQQLEQSVRVLASDLFEGRAPGTVGEERTIGYLVGRFQALGLEPGGPDGQWVQSVPLLHTRLGQAEVLGVRQGSATTAWTAGKDVYLSTLQPRDKVAISSAPLLFVGYGVSAPERGWDDFKGADLKGKVAVFLINDPDFEAAKGDDAAGKFGDRTMTYYGRWTYKFEEAARRGAVGALIVHDTPGAGYGWNVVVSLGGENYDLVRAPDKLTSLQLQGWIEGGAAAKLFAGAGLDLASLRAKARSKGFRPVELKGASFSAAFPVTQDVIKSANVLARIPGAKRPDETVMYGAHWDAYGKGASDAQGRIYRAGANDDALGIAGLFEIARAFKAGPAPDRSILFAAWTAEERGLLGSEHYAQNPVWPLDKTVANLTIDILQTAGKAKDVILVGKGQGTLEDDLARAAAAQGRVVTPESLPERGLFYRADHFSMAKRGVPVLLMMGIAGASDLVEGGRAAGQAWVDAYTGQCYHQACDAVDATWKLDGAAQDVDLMLAIGQDLATSTRWPQWKPGSEFKSVRDASATARP
ncbi:MULTISPECIES: M28 family metallopeptidase [unclassified Sphingobium]|uniref:M28 family metallopeptidase n=1 Tax=unclassified Sphingobium TaxID=2611147 RepID=UPI000D160AD7|nr:MULTISPECIES: M28 family metallopeptidase [unclassified Sphingobium]MBG6117318.1 Zn-dependent M28 family amino/carboxypeptidase [Sphingobium sp. JAI105]PSO11158.1 peptidase M20 [Sphingobium sp. AEW4]TWD12476.1 Zn-dependent M28 family amino/carboxypeptidase [Sphingobium sp. AEW010]TWD30247.1 Zn-dependent M28 family amino/carboxypeptidase [Sphingobium sp. AEW013]TWD30998.1 Zn-dependent M28 family amino/carboxypeptidase [Sphingobium sp. AEW001]